MNAIDLILLAVIGLILFMALRKAIRSRGSCGCSSCGGSCSACNGSCASCGETCPKRQTDGNEK